MLTEHTMPRELMTSIREAQPPEMEEREGEGRGGKEGGCERRVRKRVRKRVRREGMRNERHWTRRRH
jgi:hypothetical protein